MTRKKQISVSLFATAAVTACAIYFLNQAPVQEIPKLPEVQNVQAVPSPEPQPVKSLEEEYPFVFAKNSTLFTELRKLGVDGSTIQKISTASKPQVNLSKIIPGTRYQVIRSANSSQMIESIKFYFSPVESLIVTRNPENGADTWVAEKITETINTETVTYSGVVSTSLWDSAEQAQMDPELISDLAEIFAWQVDFAREVRVNDRWRLSVEKKLVKGKTVGWGSIVAAEYENAGQLFSATLFRAEGKNLGYFAPDGTSLRRMFLKSPIRYGRISSRFTKNRFHPILKTNRAHLGVDYAAPIGTPIRAVGDGVITLAAWSGGGGKVIKIRHNSTYETAYKHLRGFAPNVRSGARVSQGQIIGYVGTTGLSTGPHLHFEFFKDGRFVDPLGKKFPSADPIPKNLLAQFQAESSGLLGSLPAWP